MHDFGYLTYGRPGTVSNGVFSATYGYLADSDLLRTTSCCTVDCGERREGIFPDDAGWQDFIEKP